MGTHRACWTGAAIVGHVESVIGAGHQAVAGIGADLRVNLRTAGAGEPDADLRDSNGGHAGAWQANAVAAHSGDDGARDHAVTPFSITKKNVSLRCTRKRTPGWAGSV